jgi:hypothetical protein
MSDSPITRRIQQLFEKGEEADRLPLTPSPSGGWSWACNSIGIYQVCSGAVSQCLQFNPDQFIGQSIFTFQISPESVPLMEEALKQGDYPYELDVLFKNSQDECIPVHMHVFAQPRENGVIPGWYGFNLLMTSSFSLSERDQAVTLLSQGQPIEARRLLRSIINRQPHDETAWLWLASTFEGDARRLEILENYLEKYPGSPAIHQMAARLRGNILRNNSEKVRLAAIEILAAQDEDPVPLSPPPPIPPEEKQNPHTLFWSILIIGATIIAAVLYVFLK